MVFISEKGLYSEFHAVGKDASRKDGVAKVTGREMFPSDVEFCDLLHAKVLVSPYSHAEVVKIDTSKAEKEGGICITFEDVPEVVYNERLVSISEVTFRDKKVLTKNPLYKGEPVAAVAAESEKKALQCIERIDADFEELDPVVSIEEAVDPQSPLLHESVLVGEEEIEIERNISSSLELSEGDVENGFEEADVVVEDEYETCRQYHAQLETKSVVCRPEPDGGITVWTTTQTIHNVRILLGRIFDIPLSKIDVRKLPVGGAFGSSIQMNSVVPICVALALKANKPVKLVSSREEDMYDHCRYPTKIKYRMGAKKDGTLVAGEMKVKVDNGAHNIQAYPLLGCMAGFWVSLYKIPNIKFEGKSYYTNKAPACAKQGFGNPQVTFAVESLMEELAEKLDMDPLELRLKNYRGLGDMFWGQGPSVKSVIKSCGVEELIEKGAEKIGWDKRKNHGEKNGRIRRGIGMARGFHTSSAGGPLPGEAIDYSSALVKINEDGSVDIATALQDCGGGTLDAGAKIVAEELGVPLDKVGLSPVGTRTTTYDVCTHATRGVYAGGGAIHKAAKEAKKQLFEFASKILEVPTDALQVKPDFDSNQGKVYVEGVLEKEISIGEVAETAREKDWGTISAVENKRQTNCPPAFSTQYVEVEVDMETGQIEIKRAVLGNDAGTVVNPKLARGQLHGGFYRGAGMALIEDTNYKESGELAFGGYLTDYKMLTSKDLPTNDKVETFFAETEEPTGPFGAKGIGEAALNPAPAAVVNAIYNATGIRFTKIPVTKEKFIKKRDKIREGEEG